MMLNNQEIMIKSAGLTYRVLIEEDALNSVGKAMRLLFPSVKTLLISDTTVCRLYGEKALSALAGEKWQVSTVLVRPGESSKSLTAAARIYDAAIEAGLDRNSPIIALGGGVVGDLAGFAAATFLRGVPLVMIPTTLLAQVDSGVGGKVAVNHRRGKKLIGAIYPPRLVVIDPLVLKTLPRRQLQAGLAEVVKYGIINNSSFFFWLEDNLERLLQGDSALLQEAVAESVRAKAGVVEADEYEKDYRRVLNFGHTIGHALEAATAYRYYLHGEAVLIGMSAAVKMAVRLVLLDQASAERILALLKHFKQKKAPEGLTAEKVIDKLRQDKKRRGNEIIFVLPTAIGSATMVPVDDQNLIRAAVESYLHQRTGYLRE
jgi:3-dehydroquinate synthase